MGCSSGLRKSKASFGFLHYLAPGYNNVPNHPNEPSMLDSLLLKGVVFVSLAKRIPVQTP